ncbi:hypothetical protein MSBR3_1934 [Methanosarcina barkeri 3]|uniref:Pentapeptide repeat family protein n=1 Tax=Methanosarcina barkeri 3 TaxID=1434107 RepID=A0A0E3SM78_METBA|nr:pentapeptide repeat-containing protein [Methanosarcina barkeri]AKB82512.1 hypothetical protein MSBR3_1934 [Methanosarcina barkeri 3]
MALKKEAYENVREHKLLIWILIVFAVALVFIALLLGYLVFTYPVNQVSQYGITNATEKANLINQYRTTSIQLISIFAQIFGGIAVLIGIYFAWGNLTTAREGQITERFTRAVNQLGAIDQSGNPAIEIRLGGIYALERIADRSGKDYWPIMEILTAYIRKNSPIENYNIKTEDIKNQDKVSFDIQAILTVIKRRRYFFNSGESDCLDLHETCLNGANLKGAHLEKVNLYRANLKKADLEGAYLQEADFLAAKLRSANLKKANLCGADLEEANLCGADLEGAHLKDVNSSPEFPGLDAIVSVDQLSKVKTLYNAELDDELEKILRDNHPYLFSPTGKHPEDYF